MHSVSVLSSMRPQVVLSPVSRSQRGSSRGLPRVALASSLLMLLIVLLQCGIGPVMAQDNPIRYVRADELRDHSGRCFDASRCSLKDVGEEWTVHSECEKSTCQVAANGTLMEKRTRCREPSPILSEDCYILRVEGRPFPHCCPKLFCNDKPVTPELK